MISVFDCLIVNVPKIVSLSGNISVLENDDSVVPFNVKRIFYLYDIPGGESRGAHAHKECHQFLLAASGSFEVHLDDGKENRIVTLQRADVGLHVPPGIWASETNFSTGSICLVLASEKYDEADYIRDYSKYIEYKK